MDDQLITERPRSRGQLGMIAIARQHIGDDAQDGERRDSRVRI
jgi:hypothetical protein